MSFVVRCAGVHEDAIPEPRHAQWRRRRNAKLDRSCHKRVADGAPGTEATQIARAPEQRLVKGWGRPAEIFSYCSKCNDSSSIHTDVAVRVDFCFHRGVRRRKM